MTPPTTPLAISWVLSTVSGYGIYGIQILLQYLRKKGRIQDLLLTSAPSVSVLPSLTQVKVDPIFGLGSKIAAHLAQHPEETLNFKHAVLHGSGSNFSGFPGQDRVWGRPNVACCAIEHLICAPDRKDVAKNYDMFIAISKWNADFLQSLDVGPVHLCYQGIDPSLFFAGPSTGLIKDRFVIFSGGKFEFRKGQDIILAAFKIFHKRHPDALLVTCWQNLLAPEIAPFALAGHCESVPETAPDYGLRITPWLLKQGLAPESFIDLPFTHNLLMPQILRECDMAVFANRCEGGTNLVAMETMACGIPTFVSYNTGQKDLVDLIDFLSFKSQQPVRKTEEMESVEGWGETNVDEVVAAMETVYMGRDEARREAVRRSEKMKNWDWSSLNDKLIDIVCEGKRSE